MPTPDRLVFLSYHKRNRPVAVALAERFEDRRKQLGLNVEFWFDARIEGGDAWDEVVQDKINAADIVLFLVTSASVQATYMWHDELSAAKDRMPSGVRVIPLRYNDVLTNIHHDPKTRHLHRLPHKAVDELGESAWLDAVVDGIFLSLRNSLEQRPRPSDKLLETWAAAKERVEVLESKFHGMEEATFGSLRGRDIIACVKGCELALRGADPRKVARDLEIWRRRLAPARVKLGVALPHLSAEIGELVHVVEALQTWAAEEQPAGPLDDLAPSFLLDPSKELELIQRTQANIEEADKTLKAIGAAEKHGELGTLVQDVGARAGSVLEQAQINLSLTQVDLSAVEENIAEFGHQEHSYSETIEALGIERSGEAGNLDGELKRSAELLNADAAELRGAYDRSRATTPVVHSTDRVGLRQLFDLDSERALLGAILFDNENYNRLTYLLRARDFFDPVHGRIFSACADLISAGELADGVTLKEHFASDGGIKEIGGATYIMKLMEAAATSSEQAQKLALLVHDLGLRRELVRVGNVIADLAENPPDNHDANDIIEEAERTLISISANAAFDGKSPLSGPLAHSLERAADEFVRRPNARRLLTYFPLLDNIIGGFREADLILVTGWSFPAKASFAISVALNIAKARLKRQQTPSGTESDEEGGVVALFSPETSADEVATDLLSMETKIDGNLISRGKLHKHEFERLTDEAIKLQQLPLHVDETRDLSLDLLYARTRRLQRTTGLDLVVVNYLDLLVPSPREESRGDSWSATVARGLKTVASNLRIPVIAISHEEQPARSKFSEDEADIVLEVVHRNRPHFQSPSLVDIVVRKNRHGETGLITLNFPFGANPHEFTQK